MIKDKTETCCTLPTLGVSLDDLPENIRCFAEDAGLTAAIKLLGLFGGECLYLPQIESVLRSKRNRVIQDSFNGSNHVELARRFNLTSRHVRKIIRMNREG